jgi:opacity protein-like surface antigen
MHRTLGAAFAAMLVCLPLSAEAQSGMGLRIGLAAGANLPNEEFSDGAKTGVVFQGWAGLGLGSLGLRGELHYSRSDLDAPIIRRVGNSVLPDDGIGETSGSVDMLGLSLNGVLNLPTPVIRPYLIGGVGWYSRDVKQDVQTDLDEFRNLDRNDSDFGWNAGAGVALPLGRLSAYLEARYHSVNTPGEKTTFVPVVLGIVF